MSCDVAKYKCHLSKGGKSKIFSHLTSKSCERGFLCIDGVVRKRKRGAKPRWCSRQRSRSTSSSSTAGTTTTSSRIMRRGIRQRGEPDMVMVTEVHCEGAHGEKK
jgi:hypothetical protein